MGILDRLSHAVWERFPHASLQVSRAIHGRTLVSEYCQLDRTLGQALGRRHETCPFILRPNPTSQWGYASTRERIQKIRLGLNHSDSTRALPPKPANTLHSDRGVFLRLFSASPIHYYYQRNMPWLYPIGFMNPEVPLDVMGEARHQSREPVIPTFFKIGLGLLLGSSLNTLGSLKSLAGTLVMGASVHNLFLIEDIFRNRRMVSDIQRDTDFLRAHASEISVPYRSNETPFHIFLYPQIHHTSYLDNLTLEAAPPQLNPHDRAEWLRSMQGIRREAIQSQYNILRSLHERQPKHIFAEAHSYDITPADLDEFGPQDYPEVRQLFGSLRYSIPPLESFTARQQDLLLTIGVARIYALTHPDVTLHATQTFEIQDRIQELYATGKTSDRRNSSFILPERENYFTYAMSTVIDMMPIEERRRGIAAILGDHHRLADDFRQQQVRYSLFVVNPPH